MKSTEKTYLKHKKKRIGQCSSLWVRADFFCPFYCNENAVFDVLAFVASTYY